MQVDNSIISEKLSIDELFNRSKKYRKSEEFSRFINFIASFNHYSRFNTMLVYLQNESVTFFGGANFWQNKFNRTVQENARPYVILQPFGPVMLVYDIFETDGEETAQEFLEKGLGQKPFEVKGRINPEILDETIELATSWGIKISFKPLSLFNEGYVTTIHKGYIEIVLKLGMGYKENLAVLIHELAHLFLGHTGHRVLRQSRRKNKGKSKEIKLFNRKLSRTAEELEAETISFLICKRLGLETKAAEYLSGYITSEQDLKEFSYELVIKTADKIEDIFLKRWTKV